MQTAVRECDVLWGKMHILGDKIKDVIIKKIIYNKIFECEVLRGANLKNLLNIYLGYCAL